MSNELKTCLCDAGRAMSAEGLAFRAWGSVSCIDRQAGLVVVTPAGGVAEATSPDRLAAVSLDGAAAAGSPAPSAEAGLHLAIYRRLVKDPAVGAIAISQGPHGTAWAQARREIPVVGTLHADFMSHPVPCTHTLTEEQAGRDCDANTADAIADALTELPDESSPGVLVAGMGLVTFGASPAEAVERAAIIERIARLASMTVEIEPYPKGISRGMLKSRRGRYAAPTDGKTEK